MATTRIPGFVFTDHTVEVPLDHYGPDDGRTIEVFAREVVARPRAATTCRGCCSCRADRAASPRARDGASDGWLRHATADPPGAAARPARHRPQHPGHRTDGARACPPTTWRRTCGTSAADSIVADAELIRARVAGGEPWETLGQSYGGFITLTYLSLAPEGLRACYVTGGLPGLTATADDVYARTYPRVAAQERRVLRALPRRRRRGPPDRRPPRRARRSAARRRPADARRLRLLGNAFGMSDGYERVHWLLDEAWHGRPSSRTSSSTGVMALTGFVDTPLFALQEYIYGQPGRRDARGRPSGRCAAPGVRRGRRPAAVHRRDDVPLDVRGDRARCGRSAARPTLLAAHATGRPLYDLDRLAANEVPVSRRSTTTTCTSTPACSSTPPPRSATARLGHQRVRARRPARRRARVLGRLMDMRAGRI